MSDILEGMAGLVTYIQTAPPVLLIILFLNALGYGLKWFAWVPNRSIPLALMLVGALLTLFLAPVPTGRNPLLLLAIMGFLFGCIAWLGHALVLKRLEKFLPGTTPDEDKPQPPTKP